MSSFKINIIVASEIKGWISGLKSISSREVLSFEAVQSRWMELYQDKLDAVKQDVISLAAHQKTAKHFYTSATIKPLFNSRDEFFKERKRNFLKALVHKSFTEEAFLDKVLELVQVEDKAMVLQDAKGEITNRLRILSLAASNKSAVLSKEHPDKELLEFYASLSDDQLDEEVQRLNNDFNQINRKLKKNILK